MANPTLTFRQGWPRNGKQGRWRYISVKYRNRRKICFPFATSLNGWITTSSVRSCCSKKTNSTSPIILLAKDHVQYLTCRVPSVSIHYFTTLIEGEKKAKSPTVLKDVAVEAYVFIHIKSCAIYITLVPCWDLYLVLNNVSGFTLNTKFKWFERFQVDDVMCRLQSYYIIEREWGAL